MKTKDRRDYIDKNKIKKNIENKELKNKNIALLLNCNYETEEFNDRREKLIIRKPNIHWCLDELSNFKITDTSKDIDASWLKAIKSSYQREISVYSDDIYVEITGDCSGIDTIEKLKENLLAFRAKYPKLVDLLEQRLIKAENEFKLNDFLPIPIGDFIERENIYEIIDKILFKNNKFAIIQGMGGIGKSSLLIQYAHRLLKEKNKYIVRFMDCSTSENIVAEYKQMAKLLNIEIEKVKDDDMKNLVQDIYSKLSKYDSKIFLIFDNLKEMSSIRKYLVGLSDNVNVAITIRNSNEVKNIGDKFELIELNNFKFGKK